MAKEYYTKAIEINSRCSRGHIGLARIFISHAEYEKARTHFEATLEVDNLDGDTHLDLADLLWEQLEDFSAARDHYETAIAMFFELLQTCKKMKSMFSEHFSL